MTGSRRACLAAAMLLGAVPPAGADRVREGPAVEAYACPMHPEVKEQPARCPECGMALQPVYRGAGAPGMAPHMDHEPRHGGLLTMAGSFHIEFLEQPGAVLVYLYDQFTQPLPTAGIEGARLHYKTGMEAPYAGPVPLAPAPDGTHLAAAVPADAALYEVSVIIPYEGQEVQVNCPLRLTFDGSLVDLSCYLALGDRVLTEPACSQQGLAAGRPAAFLIGQPAVQSVYVLADRLGTPPAEGSRWLPYAGARVRLTGRILRRKRLQLLDVTALEPLRTP